MHSQEQPKWNYENIWSLDTIVFHAGSMVFIDEEEEASDMKLSYDKLYSHISIPILSF